MNDPGSTMKILLKTPLLHLSLSRFPRIECLWNDQLVLDPIKYVLLTFLLVFSTAESFSQDTSTEQKQRSDFIISANIGGDASLLSLSFDKLFFLKPALALSSKVGFGFNQDFQLYSEPPSNYFILPHHLTCLWGRRKSFLDFGVGAAWITNNREHYYPVFPILGYRYHPLKNPGFSFRVWLYYPFGQKNYLDWDVIMLVPYGLSFGIAL